MACVLAGVLVAGSLLVACGDDDDDDDGGAAGATVGVTLDEFSIALEDQPSAGEVTFEIENAGEETHEFVVLKTDLDMLDLPTADDGSVDEEGSDDIEIVDEAEDIASGDSVDLTVDLDDGAYVVICNIVEEEDGEPESHYQEGMRASMTIE